MRLKVKEEHNTMTPRTNRVVTIEEVFALEEFAPN